MKIVSRHILRPTYVVERTIAVHDASIRGRRREQQCFDECKNLIRIYSNKVRQNSFQSQKLGEI